MFDGRVLGVSHVDLFEPLEQDAIVLCYVLLFRSRRQRVSEEERIRLEMRKFPRRLQSHSWPNLEEGSAVALLLTMQLSSHDDRLTAVLH